MLEVAGLGPCNLVLGWSLLLGCCAASQLHAGRRSSLCWTRLCDTCCYNYDSKIHTHIFFTILPRPGCVQVTWKGSCLKQYVAWAAIPSRATVCVRAYSAATLTYLHLFVCVRQRKIHSLASYSCVALVDMRACEECGWKGMYSCHGCLAVLVHCCGSSHCCAPGVWHGPRPWLDSLMTQRKPCVL